MDHNFANIHRQYGNLSLETQNIESPFILFQLWLDEYLANADVQEVSMVLSTVDEHGHPDSRVVLLKEFAQDQLIFYTNYQSIKGQQIELMPYVALNFYWHKLARQVRFRGKISKISAQKSDQYFYSRPLASQISAILSDQSSVLHSRVELENQIQAILDQNPSDLAIVRPKHWGGYAVSPDEIEFWQGRNDRVSDRIKYKLQNNGRWDSQRLAP
jgi:pyridoxamine 5'-phosphate oxidase